MVKIKFKRRALGTVKFFGVPRMISKPQRLSFKTKHTSPSFASFTNIPRPTSVSIFAPSMNRPALKFYGDSDGDGVMNGFDCAPNNKKLQGPQHRHRENNWEQYGLESERDEDALAKRSDPDGSWTKELKEKERQAHNKRALAYNAGVLAGEDYGEVHENADRPTWDERKEIERKTFMAEQDKKDIAAAKKEMKYNMKINKSMEEGMAKMTAKIKAEKALEAKEDRAEEIALIRLDKEEEHND